MDERLKEFIIGFILGAGGGLFILSIIIIIVEIFGRLII